MISEQATDIGTRQTCSRCTSIANTWFHCFLYEFYSHISCVVSLCHHLIVSFYSFFNTFLEACSWKHLMGKRQTLLNWSWGQGALTQQCSMDPLIAHVHWDAACLKTPKWCSSCHFASHCKNSRNVWASAPRSFWTHVLLLCFCRSPTKVSCLSW